MTLETFVCRTLRHKDLAYHTTFYVIQRHEQKWHWHCRSHPTEIIQCTKFPYEDYTVIVMIYSDTRGRVCILGHRIEPLPHHSLSRKQFMFTIERRVVLLLTVHFR
jgi:hypothetical protein